MASYAGPGKEKDEYADMKNPKAKKKNLRGKHKNQYKFMNEDGSPKEGYIINPETGNPVKKNGNTGRRVLRTQREKEKEVQIGEIPKTQEEKEDALSKVYVNMMSKKSETFEQPKGQETEKTEVSAPIKDKLVTEEQKKEDKIDKKIDSFFYSIQPRQN